MFALERSLLLRALRMLRSIRSGGAFGASGRFGTGSAPNAPYPPHAPNGSQETDLGVSGARRLSDSDRSVESDLEQWLTSLLPRLTLTNIAYPPFSRSFPTARRRRAQTATRARPFQDHATGHEPSTTCSPGLTLVGSRIPILYDRRGYDSERRVSFV
ncbi:hypothetical protein EXIGLDRAFT_340884 [Exidia glandulosa HHB12029]|uniref:Uncharacterized protein n=1 Tax=Exidia glandulosa HHB12029 TaxID=1314781 RepID=A0A165CIE4_EXIGL|nr:hypothetical protein EXIGLDRAFT_340884 [Exidia glandulosa HHB12029]